MQLICKTNSGDYTEAVVKSGSVRILYGGHRERLMLSTCRPLFSHPVRLRFWDIPFSFSVKDLGRISSHFFRPLCLKG